MHLPPLRRFIKGLFAAALLAQCANPLCAWWNSDWASRRKVTIDPAAAGLASGDAIGGTAVLLRLHDGNFNFAALTADGADLRFVAEDDKTVLPHHIEKMDTVLNEAFVWVRVPDLKPGVKTSIWVYYGNAKPPAATSTAKDTYDKDTVLVAHFAEHGQPAGDSSGSGNAFATAGTPADGALIGTGLRLDGRTALMLPASASLAWAQGATLTWSAWIKPTALTPNAVLFQRHEDDRTFTIGLDRGSPYCEVTGLVEPGRTSSGAPLAINSWHHLAVVADGRVISVYLDGRAYGSVTATLPALTGPYALGGDDTPAVPGSVGFQGEIDELQISKEARPVTWLVFSQVNQGGGEAANHLLTIGDEEQDAGALAFLKTGYLGVIIGSLTVDGWVVIGLLLVMMAISWAVMIGKAMYLNRVVKGNELFLREWKQVSRDLAALDDAESEKAKRLGGQSADKNAQIMHAAPLYRVYHIGAEEISHRVSAGRKGARVLSARSIQAIRASLDAGLVRETHRLSSQMVLLTIAISGGPFLGLLGTVVGVMITFAAVASAGEVNVNAIAPGIAAALAATVAGLAVAIPALFGYNYLLGRVKNATSDMHVFIDEFVAKMAEFYSEPAAADRTITRAPFSPNEP